MTLLIHTKDGGKKLTLGKTLFGLVGPSHRTEASLSLASFIVISPEFTSSLCPIPSVFEVITILSSFTLVFLPKERQELSGGRSLPDVDY